MACALGACGDEDDPFASFECDAVAPDAGGALPEDVVEILERRCWACHGDPTDRFAPMPLVTWSDFHGCHYPEQTEPDYERMRIRINSERFPMPPTLEPQLTEEERAVLNRWIAAGAPAL